MEGYPGLSRQIHRVGANGSLNEHLCASVSSLQCPPAILSGGHGAQLVQGTQQAIQVGALLARVGTFTAPAIQVDDYHAIRCNENIVGVEIGMPAARCMKAAHRPTHLGPTYFGKRHRHISQRSSIADSRNKDIGTIAKARSHHACRDRIRDGRTGLGQLCQHMQFAHRTCSTFTMPNVAVADQSSRHTAPVVVAQHPLAFGTGAYGYASTPAQRLARAVSLPIGRVEPVRGRFQRRIG